MDTNCCSKCAHTRLLSCFLKNASANLESKVFQLVFLADQSKRRALQPLHSNAPSKRATTRPAELSIQPPKPSHLLPQPESHPHLPPLLESCLVLPLQPELRPLLPPPLETRPVPQHPLVQPRAAGFLPAEQWEYIQRFNAAMEEVKMETCLRCK